MSKFDDMNKVTIPDPLTGGNQDIYTSKDGTFMMCIPDRCIPIIKTNPISTEDIPHEVVGGETKLLTDAQED